jgi:hypothetical protein
MKGAKRSSALTTLSSIVRRMPSPGEPDSVPNLRELVNHADVVEVLDALAIGPIAFGDLRSHVRTGRRGPVAALRVVVARGLVISNDNGTWDSVPPEDVVYRPTPLGRQVLEALSLLGLDGDLRSR